MKTLLEKATELGLFDFYWYCNQHKASFERMEEAFEDYLKKSRFSNVAPSKNFDTELYYRNYLDVFRSDITALEHYIYFGINEGRKSFPLRIKWLPKKEVAIPKTDYKFSQLRIAIVLHIYYSDYIYKFATALSKVSFYFDLYITATDATIKDKLLYLKNNKHIKNIYFKCVPNQGRNFAFLVEFRKEISNYDLFLHLHSKKSLYSGREQNQWADYLIEYLVADTKIVSNAIKILINNNFGLYYPVTFWMMPSFTNHWLMNKEIGFNFLKKISIDCEHHLNFISYPVGSMFWAKPQALMDILDYNWTYDDFPKEPIPNDGTILHAIERVLPIIAEKNGYKKLFYNPPTGQFTDDNSYIYRDYYNISADKFISDLDSAEILSFDIFDTIVRRAYWFPDYAKYLLADKLNLGINGAEFVRLRNKAELKLRIDRNFQGDVDIYEIYEELDKLIRFRYNPKELADAEFETDLEMLRPNKFIIDIINTLGKRKLIWFVTDTYYTLDQIKAIINKVGVFCEYSLFVSSNLRLRKDNGTMWNYIINKFQYQENHNLLASGKFLHIGDNAVSDCQIPGDKGIRTLHLLSPPDKWIALNFNSDVIKRIGLDDINFLKKWGPLISYIGSIPFIRFDNL